MSKTKPTILVVDDTPDNIQIIHGILSEHYIIRAATSGEKALQLAHIDPLPSLILLDVMMPGIDGFQTCCRLKLDPVTFQIPVIFVTAKTDTIDERTGFELGAVDYISKPVSPPILKARVQNHLALSNQKRELETLVQIRTNELEQTRQKVINTLGRAAEFRDNETGLHITRMSHYSYMLAQQIGAAEQWCKLLLNAAPMHDIGKIGIPDAILLKPSKLTDEERVIMQRHAEFGAEIIGNDDDPLLSLAKEIALYHHERWDGTGYPQGVSGKDIPISARIVAIADVFDALTSARPYKKPWSIDDALAYLVDGSDTQFDSELITAFMKCHDDIIQIHAMFSD